MKLNYFVFCDAAARTDTGKAILFGIFDAIHVDVSPSEDNPIVHPSLTLAFQVKGENLKHKNVTLRIISETSGREIFANTVESTNPEEERTSIAGNWSIGLLKLTELGNYRASLEIDGELVGVTTFSVVLNG